jgi:hypothetical protein
MFNIGAFLNNLDNAAKETLEEPKVSATSLRSRRKGDNGNSLLKDDGEITVRLL